MDMSGRMWGKTSDNESPQRWSDDTRGGSRTKYRLTFRSLDPINPAEGCGNYHEKDNEKEVLHEKQGVRNSGVNQARTRRISVSILGAFADFQRNEQALVIEDRG